MRLRDVVNSEKCHSKDMYSDFSEKKEKNYYNGIVIRELFKKHGLRFISKDVLDTVKEVMPPELFHTSREATINTSLLVLRLLRFQEYCNKYSWFSNAIKNGAKVHGGSSTFVTSYNIEVDYSFIIEDGDSIYIYKVKNSKKQGLTPNGKTVFTKISDNMELFLLQIAAEKLFPGKSYYSANIMFLRTAKDKNDTLVPAITYSKESDIHVETSFYITKKAEMFDRLDRIIAGNSAHHCEDCSTCAYYRLCKYEKDETNAVIIPKQAKATNVSFTKAQNEMIHATAGIYRVLAGAGSGKTTCIANRICNLVKVGIKPENILLITYTTKGVQEMHEKIEYWLNRNNIKADIKDFQIFTFNSFGFELVKKEYTRFGYTKEPTLLEKSEKIALIKQLLDSQPEIPGFNYKDPVLDMPYAKGVVLMMDKYFSQIKAGGLTYPDEVRKTCYIKSEETATEVLKLYRKYINHMLQNNLVDYSDQINLCLEIMSDPVLLEKYGFSYIMVDEFQDSDSLQINILMRMAKYSKFASLMVVGDDSQAIFSWRGATARNIIHFKDVFPTTYDIKLMENFRSTANICELANAINNINIDKVPKELISDRQGNKPFIFSMNNYTDFVDKVIEIMLYYGYNLSDIAMIARNKKDLLEIQKELIKRGVANVIAVNELLIDNPVIQHLIDFANFLQDPKASLSFAEYLQVADYENYKKQTKHTLPKYVENAMEAFQDDLDHCTSEQEKIQYVFDKFEQIAQTERSVKSLLDVLKGRLFITLKEMAKFMLDMETYKAEYTIEKIEQPVNGITLTTAHSSKGREWEFVAVYLPSFSYPLDIEYIATKNNPQFEEERRLLFVAITRAKESLLLGGDVDSSIFKEVRDAQKTAEAKLKKK